MTLLKKDKSEKLFYSLYYCNPSMELNLLNLARIIARIPTIINAFEDDSPAHIIYPLVESILHNTEDIQYIVIMDLQGIRYSHPNPGLIGDHFVGGDEELAIKEGKEYISIAEGTLGLATRAFVPINNFQGDRIGVLCVGILNNEFNQKALKFKSLKAFNVMAGAVLGLMTSSPSSLANMFQHMEAVLQKIRSFKHCLYIKLKINKEKDENRPHNVDEATDIITKQIPSYIEMKGLGIFHSKQASEEILQLKEELKGSKMMVNTLRENNHEVMNKLHVIMGLLELKKYQEAEEYVNTFFYTKQRRVSNIMKNIESNRIAALLISKYNIGMEIGIELILHPESRIEKDFLKINTNAIVTILGNLIDNAFDALKDENKAKWVKVLIRNNMEELVISIKDNGIGMERENKAIIFERGFSTKEIGRGTGLYLVNKIVRSLYGEIKIRSWPNKGTHFIIKLPNL